MRGSEEDFEYQGKRKDQVEFSEMMASSSVFLMILLIFIAFIIKIIKG
tara:strand:- start:126 stop:269 length:144 start_codon:yes stop_codon:yes gene_type:complete